MTDEPSHDPLRFVADFRDHLARHDRPIAFLFGAGTSCAVDTAEKYKEGNKDKFVPLIPAVNELTEMCKSAVVLLGEQYEKAWVAFASECAAKGRPANIEDILSLIRKKSAAIGPDDRLSGLAPEELSKCETKIRETIVAAVAPEPNRLPPWLPHDDLAIWIKHATRTNPVEIFTTNYDLLLERSIESHGIPVFDGFVGSYRPFFHADSVEREELLPGSSSVRLWKIHGSINWHVEVTPRGPRIIRTSAGESGQLILPSHLKYEESRQLPYIAMLNRLARVLNKDDSLLITAGYSFSDQHINSVIFGALENHPGSHVIALMYSDIKEEDALARQASLTTNILAVGPTTAVIRGVNAKWRRLGTGGEATGHFMDAALDSNNVGGEGESDVQPEVALGDFNRLCSSLRRMGEVGP